MNFQHQLPVHFACKREARAEPVLHMTAKDAPPALMLSSKRNDFEVDAGRCKLPALGMVSQSASDAETVDWLSFATDIPTPYDPK